MAAPVTPAPGNAASITLTRQPASARASAHALPTTPAPTTITDGEDDALMRIR